jgi:hypothetical protein
MSKLVLSSMLALALLPAPARPQAAVQLEINLGLPPRPPLVVVQPGIQVVENWNEEVFFSGGWYWVRRDGGWYRARSPRATFVWVEPRRVPPGLLWRPPGYYRHFHRDRARAEERAWRDHQRAERRERKERERAEWRARQQRERERVHPERVPPGRGPHDRDGHGDRDGHRDHDGHRD